MQKFGTADKTNFVESLHALALQIAVRERRDITWEFITENFAKYSRTVNHNFKSMDLVKKSTPDWQKSAVETANALWRRFPANSVVHRDSGVEQALRNKFTQLNARDRQFNQWDKYQPADIYVTANTFRPALYDKKSFAQLNDYLREQADRGNFVGVSLKKVSGSPRVEEVNFGNQQERIELDGFNFSAQSSDPLSTKIVWMKAKEGNRKHSFEIRTNAPWGSWSVQLDGGSHYGGKAGVNAVNDILVANGAQPIPQAAQVKARLKSSPQSVYTETQTLLQRYSGSFSAKNVDQQEDTWVYSKYLGLKFVDSIKRLPKTKQDQIANELVLYASSRSANSAPHLKVY